MKKQSISGLVLLVLMFTVQKVQSGDFFTEFYSEAVKAHLTGLSTSGKLNVLSSSDGDSIGTCPVGVSKCQ